MYGSRKSSTSASFFIAAFPSLVASFSSSPCGGRQSSSFGRLGRSRSTAVFFIIVLFMFVVVSLEVPRERRTEPVLGQSPEARIPAGKQWHHEVGTPLFDIFDLTLRPN